MEKQATTRQLKVAREIQKDLAEIIRSKGMAFFGGAMVTVSEVRVSPDLSIAKTYVSIFPSSKAEEVMKILASKGLKPVNIDATIMAQKPKLSSYIEEMRENIAGATGLDKEFVNVKATTEEGLGFTGTSEGMKASAVCLVE